MENNVVNAGAQDLKYEFFSEQSRAVFDKLCRSYRSYFDIEHDFELYGQAMPAWCHFCSRSEKYVLIKKAQLWAMECEEYIAIFETPNLDEEALRRIAGALEAAESEYVKPREDHMYTYLTAIVIAGKIEDAAAKLLKRHKFRKSYKLGVHGWCQVRLAVVGLDGKCFSNVDGRPTKKFIDGLFNPKPKRRRAKLSFARFAR